MVPTIPKWRMALLGATIASPQGNLPLSRRYARLHSATTPPATTTGYIYSPPGKGYGCSATVTFNPLNNATTLGLATCLLASTTYSTPVNTYVPGSGGSGGGGTAISNQSLLDASTVKIVVGIVVPVGVFLIFLTFFCLRKVYFNKPRVD